MKKKRVVFIVDVRNWAFDNIAQFLKTALDQEYDVNILYTSDYNSPMSLLKDLSKYSKVDFVHFFYRGYLKILLEEVAVKNDKILSDFLCKLPITTSIPDHLFLENKSDILSMNNTLNFADNYYTTSSKLHDIYSKVTLYPTPYKDVIFDNIVIKNTIPSIENNEKLVVTWVGNSKWGEWCYSKENDVKGYDSIIKPIMKHLENVEFCIIDSNVKKYSKSEVLRSLNKTDILLISSSSEGTPLPLIESMSQGCAIITTDVGIASEVLPNSQKPFVVNRNIADFILKIKELDSNRKLLTKLKKDNLDRYEKIFGNKDLFAKKWFNLIEDTISRNKERKEIKANILNQIASINKTSLVGGIKNLIIKVAKERKIKAIIIFFLKFPPFRFIARILLYILSKYREGNFNEFALSVKEYKAISKVDDEDKILALYHSTYPGVANSTTSLFKHTLDLCFNKTIDKLGLPSFVITNIAKSILKTNARKVIISGGSVLQNQIAERIFELNNDSKIDMYFLWHGSPAQWSEKHHLESASKYIEMHKRGIYKGIITLKKDLESTLDAYRINSILLQNFVPDNSSIQSGENKKFTVGIWSAYAIWVKNLFPQFMSLALLEGEVICNTNFSPSDKDKWIFDAFQTKFYSSSMKHKELLEAMSKTDVTLYVTNTECSPMIALESLSLGIPCLVGPTSGLYDSDPYLRDMLTVNRVDSPKDIAKAIERVRSSIKIIKAKIPSFVEKYNDEAESLKKEFLSSMLCDE